MLRALLLLGLSWVLLVTVACTLLALFLSNDVNSQVQEIGIRFYGSNPTIVEFGYCLKERKGAAGVDWKQLLKSKFKNFVWVVQCSYF